MSKDIVTRTLDAPAELLDKTIETSEVIGHQLNSGKTLQKTKDYWHTLGPGLTTGAADDDPSGIATYSQTGAQYGFRLLWLALFVYPLAAVIQEMCGRIGIVTGRGLAGNIRLAFSHRILYTCTLLLFVANAINIGADLGAMAQGIQLVLPQANFMLLVTAFTIIMLSLQIFTPYERYAKYLKWLAMVLFAYVLSALFAHLDWGNVLRHAVIPQLSFNKDQLLLVCAILGTTISPYLFFWQTSQEVEEQIVHGNTTIRMRQQATSRPEIHGMRIDVWSGMLLSELIMFFIIAACGALLFPHGIMNIESSAQAAEALRPFAGNAAYFLFAVGIIGTGMLGIPVLAGSSSYAITESLKKQGGLSKRLSQAHTFYGVIIISMLVGLAMNFIGINPIKALIASAVVNGIVAPIIMVFIMLISSNRKIMGNWTNRPLSNIIGWGTTGLMAVAGIAAIVSLL
jgi:NRAMP (natural resistance-associated macrophage protein)-like metal ion transporter